MSAYKKTSLMRQVERAHPGKTLDQIVRDELSLHGTIEGAAESLGVSAATLSKNWMPRLGIQLQTKVEVVSTPAAQSGA